MIKLVEASVGLALGFARLVGLHMLHMPVFGVIALDRLLAPSPAPGCFDVLLTGCCLNLQFIGIF